MRILFLTHRLPYAPNRGDRIRAYHIARQLARRADVDLLSLTHDDEEESHVAELCGMVARSADGTRPASRQPGASSGRAADVTAADARAARRAGSARDARVDGRRATARRRPRLLHGHGAVDVRGIDSSYPGRR